MIIKALQNYIISFIMPAHPLNLYTDLYHLVPDIQVGKYNMILGLTA